MLSETICYDEWDDEDEDHGWWEWYEPILPKG
jgi:hypothetical protein